MNSIWSWLKFILRLYNRRICVIWLGFSCICSKPGILEHVNWLMVPCHRTSPGICPSVLCNSARTYQNIINHTQCLSGCFRENVIRIFDKENLPYKIRFCRANERDSNFEMVSNSNHYFTGWFVYLKYDNTPYLDSLHWWSLWGI